MRQSRKLALFVLAIYVLLIVGISLHIHANNEHANCQLCQISHTSVIATAQQGTSLIEIHLGLTTPETERTSGFTLASPFSGRAPPQA